MKKLLVILMAIAMVGAFTIPAAAADWSFKGDARMDTYMVDQDEDLAGFDDSDLLWTKQDVLTRLGIKAVADDITGYIEIRSNTGSFVRHWFGEWDFGSGKLLVGKTWTPATVFTNGQNYADNIMGAFGNMNWRAARIDQIRFTLLDGNLKLGFLAPNTSYTDIALGAGSDTDTTLPTIEASYTLKLEPVKLIFCGGYASITQVDPADNEYDVDSNFFGIAAFANFGEMYVNAEARISTNEGDYGFNGSQYTDTFADIVAGDVEDNDGLAYALIVGYKASDTVKVEAGYGFISGEDDSAAEADEASMMYVMVPITLAKGVTISPEVGIIDYMDDNTGAAQGEETYFGATWKISF